MMRKVIPFIVLAFLFSGCTTNDELKRENERLRSQNRELRQLLQQTRRDTNRKQINSQFSK